MHDPDDLTTRSTDPEGSETFYGRWSRRKRASRGPEVAPETVDAPAPLPGAGPAPASGAPGGAPEAPAEPARVLTDADMPDLDSLGEDGDYSPFLSPGVSEGLRTRALRKLFLSSQFNVVDGLNDYDDDFTTFEALGDIVTSDMRHRMEQEAEKARARAEEEARALLEEDAGTPPTGEETRPGEGEDEEAGAVARVGDGGAPAPDALKDDGAAAGVADGTARTPVSGGGRDDVG